MSMIYRPIPLVALAGLALAGCNDDVPFFPPADATPLDAAGSDTGTTHDGGVTADTGAQDAGGDGGPIVDVGLDAGPTPDGSLDVGPNSTLRAAIVAYCEAGSLCVDRMSLVNRCIGYYSDLEATFDSLDQTCQDAVLSYFGCAAASDEACHGDDGELSFDGELGCEAEYALQQESCPPAD
ncbi:MAG: hypothetical protein ACI81R_002212 [Bradymonadia bacterium]|jgi:hypothetical protein